MRKTHRKTFIFNMMNTYYSLSSPKEVGDYLGVTPNKIAKNDRELINGWLISKYNVVKTYNPFIHKALERKFDKGN
ncbi:hypothetical protein [Priestia megaterium]|uniref:hypothetical protein n=1 Tax=Priestia megaterium TaxID=1404 RepID=UPI00362DB978